VHLLVRFAERGVRIVALDAAGREGATSDHADLADAVRAREAEAPRWVWDDTARRYPTVLAAGLRVARCVDLRLSRAILRSSAHTRTSELATSPADAWDSPRAESAGDGAALFDVLPPDPDPGEEFRRQRAAVAAAGEAAPRLELLLAAESAGALAAAEMRHTGLPWRADLHRALLAAALGEQPAPGERPRRMTELAGAVRRALDAPDLNPDSPPELLRALTRAGVDARSTRSSELRRLTHPVIAPLLEYKGLARLFSANGWHWLDQNVRDGRFRPDFVPGGVVTGRWASAGGGGALQLPRAVRSAVVADPGWKLVVADAAQLEPRVLAALADDAAMTRAGASGDLYAGIVASGTVDSREHAKVAMLAAMYGATSGKAGRLLPRLSRAFPRAMAVVEDAARAGERGETVTTRLGRSSPPGDAPAYDETADQDRVRARARARGRFTRNFVVQGTAAEWALSWMAIARTRLHETASGVPLAEAAHLVFFVHDELVVHAPEHAATAAADLLRRSAAEAGKLLFGAAPSDFPVAVAVVDAYSDAK